MTEQAKHAATDLAQLAKHAETATMVRYGDLLTNVYATAEQGLDVALTPVSGDMLAVIRRQGVVGVLRRRAVEHERAQTDELA